MSLASTKPPEFINGDPQAILAEIVTSWEGATGKTLYPAQVEQLFAQVLAYRESLLIARINAAARQNLVRFANGPMLDYLGDMVDAPRLQMQPARTTLQFTLAAPAAQVVMIDAGTQIQTGDGRAVFLTMDDVNILPGVTQVAVAAQCVDLGNAANGYAPGTIDTPFDLPAEIAVTNLITTAGGADAELDEPYRARLLLAPAGYSVAGPASAYEFLALSAHQSIVAVRVQSPAPCEVEVFILTETGAPDAIVIDLVTAALSADDVRPLSDLVRVQAPQTTTYEIVATLTLLKRADAEATLAAARSAIDALLHGTEKEPGREQRLGVDVVPSEFVSTLRVPGVYDVVITQPAQAIVIDAAGWAHCTNVSLNVAGVQNG